MNNSKAALMITLFAATGQGKNHYTVGSVDKFLSLLTKYHKIDIQRRWIFQCLKDLLDAGYITRKARYKRRDGGLIGQIPSMISFTLQGAKYLVSRRVSGAFALLKSILNFVTGKDKRWPGTSDFLPPPAQGKKKQNQRELTKLLDSIGGAL